MSSNKSLLPSTEVVRALAAKYDNVTIKPAKIYDLILAAQIPAERVRNRYYVKTSDLPKIARFLGLERKAPSKPSSIVKDAA